MAENIIYNSDFMEEDYLNFTSLIIGERFVFGLGICFLCKNREGQICSAKEVEFILSMHCV